MLSVRDLARMGDALADAVRSCDYAFRVGGDEFTVLVVEAASEGARVFAEQALVRIRAVDVVRGDVHFGVTASAGVASFPADGKTSEEVLEHADRAVFQAKRRGRDQVVCYDPSLA